MRMMTTGAPVFLAALLVGSAAAAPAPKTLKFNLTTVTDAQGMHMNVEAKVWAKGQKARAEMNQPMTGPMVILVDGTNQYRLYPQQKRGTVSTLRPGPNDPKDPWAFLVARVDQLTRGAKKLGKQQLDGYSCDVYQKSFSPEGQTITIKSWIPRSLRPRMPIKVESNLQVKRPNVTINQTQTTRITGIQTGVPIPDSLFTVPTGYKIVKEETPGAPGLPGAPGMGRPGMGP